MATVPTSAAAGITLFLGNETIQHDPRLAMQWEIANQCFGGMGNAAPELLNPFLEGLDYWSRYSWAQTNNLRFWGEFPDGYTGCEDYAIVEDTNDDPILPRVPVTPDTPTAGHYHACLNRLFGAAMNAGKPIVQKLLAAPELLPRGEYQRLKDLFAALADLNWEEHGHINGRTLDAERLAPEKTRAVS